VALEGYNPLNSAPATWLVIALDVTLNSTGEFVSGRSGGRKCNPST
jgi:hypothetical protein